MEEQMEEIRAEIRHLADEVTELNNHIKGDPPDKKGLHRKTSENKEKIQRNVVDIKRVQKQIYVIGGIIFSFLALAAGIRGLPLLW